METRLEVNEFMYQPVLQSRTFSDKNITVPTKNLSSFYSAHVAAHQHL